MQQVSNQPQRTEPKMMRPGHPHTTERPAVERTQMPLRDIARRIAPEVAVLAVCVVLWSRTGAFTSNMGGPGPAFYPRLLIGLLAVAMLVVLLQNIRKFRRERAGQSPSQEHPGDEDEIDGEHLSARRVYTAVGFSVAYVVGTLYLGWVIATVAFLVSFLYVSGKRRLWLTVPLSAGLAILFAFIFVKVVYIALPTGIGIFDEATYRLFEFIGAY
jgi:hypothetical protein